MARMELIPPVVNERTGELVFNDAASVTVQTVTGSCTDTKTYSREIAKPSLKPSITVSRADGSVNSGVTVPGVGTETVKLQATPKNLDGPEFQWSLAEDWTGVKLTADGNLCTVAIGKTAPAGVVTITVVDKNSGVTGAYELTLSRLESSVKDLNVRPTLFRQGDSEFALTVMGVDQYGAEVELTQAPTVEVLSVMPETVLANQYPKYVDGKITGIVEAVESFTLKVTSADGTVTKQVEVTRSAEASRLAELAISTGSSEAVIPVSGAKPETVQYTVSAKDQYGKAYEPAMGSLF